MKKILFLFTILALTSKLCYAQNVVAGIEFGKTSYEEAAPKLIKKFGEPSLQKLNKTFAFKDVSYAGLMFDNIFFSLRTQKQVMSYTNVVCMLNLIQKKMQLSLEKR